MSTDYHVPVLLDEALRYLPTDPAGTYVDGTLGGGGHAWALAEQLGAQGRLIGVDQDPDALDAAAERLRGCPCRVELVRGNFADLPELLARLGVREVDGVLVDLGVSSHQLDSAWRGFSFLHDGPLDMRMDPSRGEAAEHLVDTASEEELRRIIRLYGEEPRAGRIARALVTARETEPIRSTGRLAAVVEKAVGRRGAKHPATRTFQALRIAVNRELEVLERLLASLPQVLGRGGRGVVISYHSLEDRRVKQIFRSWEPQCRCPTRAPRCTCGEPGFARVLTRKAVKPAASEVAVNPRARSARMRVIEILEPQRGSRQGGPP